MMILSPTGSTPYKSRGKISSTVDHRAWRFGWTQHNQELAAGDGQTAPSHEFVCRGVPWCWVRHSNAIRQPPNHKPLSPSSTNPIGKRPENSAPDRTPRGTTSQASQVRWMRSLRRHRCRGVVRSPSHWPLDLVGSVKNLGMLATP